MDIIPVLPSQNIERDIAWYREKTGFEPFYADPMYAGLHRDGQQIHLQWHADTEDDPLLGGSVIRILTGDAKGLFEEFVKRGTVAANTYRENTPWKTNEFGFYDLNRNAVFIMQPLD